MTSRFKEFVDDIAELKIKNIRDFIDLKIERTFYKKEEISKYNPHQISYRADHGVLTDAAEAEITFKEFFDTIDYLVQNRLIKLVDKNLDALPRMYVLQNDCLDSHPLLNQRIKDFENKWFDPQLAIYSFKKNNYRTDDEIVRLKKDKRNALKDYILIAVAVISLLTNIYITYTYSNQRKVELINQPDTIKVQVTNTDQLKLESEPIIDTNKVQ